jgi:uncharacterized protein
MSAFPEIRRQDRLLEPAQMETLLNEGEYGFLSMCATNGHGYGIPLSYAREGQCLYFHCAPEGYKLQNLTANNQVSFCVVGKTQVIPNKFTTAYQSVLVFGNMALNLTDEEKRLGLRLLVKKYCPEHIELGETYMEKSFHRVNIIRLDIKHMTGKARTAMP